jgi:RAB protein geranylgeranyltransferase component A
MAATPERERDVAGHRENHHDYVVLGTGLVESIVAAALAVVGRDVLQIDENFYYGSSWGTVSADSLERLPNVVRVPESGRVDSRIFEKCSFDLTPLLAYADGPLISLLLTSGAHAYTEFVFTHVKIWSQERQSFVDVAASKRDVFKDTSLSLRQKNSLMKALKDLTGDHGPVQEHWREVFFRHGVINQIDEESEMTDTIVHGVCLADYDPSISSNKERHNDRSLALLEMYGRSVGKYPGHEMSPFLYPKYGGGEIPSAFIRLSAVRGALQMLRCKADVQPLPDAGAGFLVEVRGDDVDYRTTASKVIRGERREDENRRSVFMIVRGKLVEQHGRCLAAFPRASSSGGVIWMLQLDQSSGCCDVEGYSVVQFWTRAAPSTHGSVVEEFREILLRFFDCSGVVLDLDCPSDRGVEDKPRVLAMWTWDETCHPNGGMDNEKKYQSYHGIYDDAQKMFEKVCPDDSFPFSSSDSVGY